jgi:hypothetical protein
VTGGEYTAVQGIPDAEHHDDSNDAHQETLHKLHSAGELDKLFLMDAIMGSGDRHKHNFMFSDAARGGLKLIDHGHAFLPTDEVPFYPEYMDAHQRHFPETPQSIHPVAAEWLASLKPEVFAQHLRANGVPEPMINQAFERLMNAKVFTRIKRGVHRSRLQDYIHETAPKTRNALEQEYNQRIAPAPQTAAQRAETERLAAELGDGAQAEGN